MKKHLMKNFAVFFGLLLVASLAVFPAATVTGQTTTNQEKAIDFMEKVLPSNIDLLKYSITLEGDSTLLAIRPPKGYNAEDVSYSLTAENSKLSIIVVIERNVIKSCSMRQLEGQAITSKPYTNLYDAVTDFLRTYQAYTNIDSNNLIQMLNNVDLTKDFTITQENIKLTITSYTLGSEHFINFKWEYMINGAAYTKLDVTFYDHGLLNSVIDTRKLYTVGDTSVNVSMDQAIDIALEGLKSYSYEMPDGSVVTGFKVQRVNVVATLEVAPFDYVLRPYWDVRMLLDEVYPGNIFALSAFIWANTGEIIEYGNMGMGGTFYSDNTNSSATPTNSNMLIIAIASVAVIAVVAIGVLVTKKKHK